MRLVQFALADGSRRVGSVENDQILEIEGISTVRELALSAISNKSTLAQLVSSLAKGASHSYDALINENRILSPLDHPDNAHCTVAGTGLTHIGSAASRSKMHSQAQATSEADMNDSMRMFKWGLERGKPEDGNPGAQPEWFYKGDGSIVVAPGASLPVPAFADDEGEEPEIVALYVIGDDAKPYRVGFAVGNEATDHVMEKKNYLYLAHSKLRHCSFGPELYVGDFPDNVEGVVRVRRGADVVWEKPFATGEANMSHSLANLEYHHFKYNQFLRPGDVHVQFLGTSVASFGDGIVIQDGDIFEVHIPAFGRPLINGTHREAELCKMGTIAAL